jgi:hypothetical protein
MDAQEVRIKLLELARPQVSNPDVNIWLEAAAALEAWVLKPSSVATPAADGQADKPHQKRGRDSGTPQARRT